MDFTVFHCVSNDETPRIESKWVAVSRVDNDRVHYSRSDAIELRLSTVIIEALILSDDVTSLL